MMMRKKTLTICSIIVIQECFIHPHAGRGCVATFQLTDLYDRRSGSRQTLWVCVRFTHSVGPTIPTNHRDPTRPPTNRTVCSRSTSLIEVHVAWGSVRHEPRTIEETVVAR